MLVFTGGQTPKGRQMQATLRTNYRLVFNHRDANLFANRNAGSKTNAHR
jgi:hypothetical protein